MIIGYVLKDKIFKIFQEKLLKLDIIAAILFVLLVGNQLLIKWYEVPRQVDMKMVIYKNPISMYIIPILYGYVIARLSVFINNHFKCFRKWFSYLGSITIPIMFLHEPLNRYCPASNNFFVYLLIGIGMPVIFSSIISSFKWCKYFGIPLKKTVEK